MQKRKKTYEVPICQVLYMEFEPMLTATGDVGPWPYGGELSKKNFFEEEDTEDTNKSVRETN